MLSIGARLRGMFILQIYGNPILAVGLHKGRSTSSFKQFWQRRESGIAVNTTLKQEEIWFKIII